MIDIIHTHQLNAKVRFDCVFNCIIDRCTIWCLVRYMLKMYNYTHTHSLYIKRRASLCLLAALGWETEATRRESIFIIMVRDNRKDSYYCPFFRLQFRMKCNLINTKAVRK